MLKEPNQSLGKSAGEDPANPINPFTRQPQKITQNLSLKGQIEDFFKEHPELKEE